ncbi:MAG: 50S ribosomal protein L6 [Dehalococcoidia bacterium]|nr:50S ribosomal protein L6 [Chloroflexota bacterium]MCK4222307.1 50S ribosomal protein L6 [Dehalococcoidia bacterium]MCK4580642.1 50S ribosomal protein L6 [Dehalococcoidia bacterium]
MSRIGLLPITVPQGVEVEIRGDEIRVKGDRGELCRRFHPEISVSLRDGQLFVARPSNDRVHRSLHGLTRSLLANMIQGVSKGFERVLEVRGVGYRVQQVGDRLSFQVGYSHRVDFPLPPGVDATVEGTDRVRISGIDKEAVGQVAARVRAIRKTDHYKGKGIKYAEEKLHLKPGKAGKVSKG